MSILEKNIVSELYKRPQNSLGCFDRNKYRPRPLYTPRLICMHDVRHNANSKRGDGRSHCK